ncbi:MAG: hypothetical protein EA349_03435 [Halomonadaceae bacterium]|nr:MAG: hypothetical protein EA349_03435 [Halomonadaceae bacterium]
MRLFKPGRNSLQQRIDSTTQRLKNRRENMALYRTGINQQLNRQLATPQTLMFAGGAGFLLGELQLLRPVHAPSATEASTAQTLAWAPNIGLLLKISLEALSWAHELFITMGDSAESQETRPTTPASGSQEQP